MDRRYPIKPMVGVGAIVFRDQDVLLVRRGTQPAYGKWSIPGGLVEVGEKLEDAVRRETWEESGLEVTVLDLVAALDRVIRDGESRIEFHYVLLDFLCEHTGGDPVPATDALECRFVPICDLSGYDMTEGTVLVIHRAMEYARGRRVPVYDPKV